MAVTNVHSPRQLLTPVELSEQLGVPIGTLYGWRTRGEGPRGIRVGRHLRYRQSDVDRWPTGALTALAARSTSHERARLGYGGTKR